jgi:hypothetical protein
MAVANDQVAHIWAQQRGNAARSHNGNFHTDGGPTIYSYSTPIASFHRRADDRYSVVLIDSDGYSNTTKGKHLGPIWRAIDYGRSVPAFRVPTTTDTYQLGKASRLNHPTNVEYLANVYHNLVKSFSRPRSRVITQYLPDPINGGGRHESEREAIARGLREAWAIVRDYCDAFALAVPANLPATFQAVDDLAAEIESDRHDAVAKANTPEAIAKRQAAAARRAERDAKRIADKLDDWRNGTSFAFYETTPEGGAFLRALNVERVGDMIVGGTLNTSMGASVPLLAAIGAFRFVKMVRKADGTASDVAWRRNGKRLPVGSFEIDKIYANGDFRAGCHFIQWSEIEALAERLGVASLGATAYALKESN